MNTTTTQSWRDVLPAISLARDGTSHPQVVVKHPKLGWTPAAVRHAYADGSIDTWEFRNPWSSYRADKFRVDLDDPPSFGYALRELCRTEKGHQAFARMIVEVSGEQDTHYIASDNAMDRIRALALGAEEPTDADRLALAKAHRELQS